ncbi:hypothetical protein BD414DRAFT_193660 [Trametes punicea]|nr:hypothetical protein BD414DRAFT_193660 [Trametes punicea]
MGAQLQVVLETLAQLQQQMQAQGLGQGQREGVKASGDKEKGDGVEEIVVAVRDGASGDEHEFKTPTEMAIEELQKKVEGVIETIKLESVPFSPQSLCSFMSS